MIVGAIRGVVRGGVAWLTGYVLTAVLAVVGVVETGSVVSGSARAYLAAHSIYPSGAGVLIAVPVLALAVAGYRAGRALQTGVVGRLRSFVQSLRGAERQRALEAAISAAVLAGGYAAAAVAIALLVGYSAENAAVGSLVYGLVVGVPAAVVGALR